MENMKTAALLFVMLSTIAATSTQAMADTQWQQTHPAREQVNQRLNNQNQRVHNEVKQGDMSKRKAARIHREDHHIRKEERRMASHHNGHITKQDQQIINSQENHVSKQIGQ